MPDWAKVLYGLRYVRGVSRGVRRGTMFPPEGRVPPREAPGGTTAEPIRQVRLDERFDFQTTLHRMPVRGLDTRLRVLHLSDVHLRGPEPWVDALCGRLGGLDRPDLTVITGDVVARGFDPSVVDRFLAAVPRGRLGTYAVIGNWEVWGGAPLEKWRPMIEAHGIPLLHDRSVDLGPLTLVGTDDALSGQPDLDAAFAGVPHDKPAVVLTHSPVLFPELVRPPVALVLAGHTHGGQVRLPVVGPFFLPRGSGSYPWGWYERDGVWLFVHRGLGWSVAPWRWRAPPELAWLELGPG